MSTTTSTIPTDMTTVEMCDVLGVCRRTLSTWRALGRVGPRPVSTDGHLKWDRAEVEAWLAARDHQGRRYDATTWPPVWAARLARRR